MIPFMSGNETPMQTVEPADSCGCRARKSIPKGRWFDPVVYPQILGSVRLQPGVSSQRTSTAELHLFAYYGCCTSAGGLDLPGDATAHRC